MGMMGKIYPEMGKVTILIILALLVSPGQGTETKEPPTLGTISFCQQRTCGGKHKVRICRRGIIEK